MNNSTESIFESGFIESGFIEADNLILIGSSGRNSGKTTLAAKLIERLKEKFFIVALKITTIEKKGGLCPRGGEGCGACSLNTDYALATESCTEGTKDTNLLLACGAEKVFWLRSLRSALRASFKEFLEKANFIGDTGNEAAGKTNMPPGKPLLIICESNSLREIVKPKIFIMLLNDNNNIKNSAKRVLDLADITLPAPFKQSDIQKILDMLC